MEENARKYDLEDRTKQFAAAVRAFVRAIPIDLANGEDARQVVRSSGSVGANYIEANEALGKKDFLMRIRVSRKEAKESRYWLELIDPGGIDRLTRKRSELVQEATELMKIFGAILRKSE